MRARIPKRDDKPIARATIMKPKKQPHVVFGNLALRQPPASSEFLTRMIHHFDQGGSRETITGELPAPNEETRSTKLGASIGAIAGTASGIAAGAALAGSIGLVPAILTGVGIAAAGTLLGLGIGALVTALAGGSAAARRNAQVVQVTPALPAEKFDHSLSGADIRSKSINPSQADRAGLTQAPLFGRLELSPAFEPGRKKDNKFAYWIHKLEFIYGFRQLIVWIAKEYSQGSCEYKATLDHEKEHVAVDQQLVREYEDKVRRAMLEFTPLPTKEEPLWVASEAEGDAAVEALKALIAQKAIGPLYDKLRDELKRSNQELDAPENYRKVYDRCSNW